MDLEGLGERVSDATGTGRVLGAHHEHQPELNGRRMTCLTYHIAPGVGSVSWEWGRRGDDT